MTTLGRICLIVAPIAILLFIVLLIIIARRGSKNACMYCNGQLIDTSYGKKCPSCHMMFEDRNNNQFNIS